MILKVILGILMVILLLAIIGGFIFNEFSIPLIIFFLGYLVLVYAIFRAIQKKEQS